MEVVECGAACLGMVLGYHGLYVPLEQLREECCVSRDGSKASKILDAGRRFAMTAAGYQRELEELRSLPLPAILHWNFNHFVVLEGFDAQGGAYLNDPAMGRRKVTAGELSSSFTGIVLTFEPDPEFKRGGQRPTALAAIRARISGLESVLVYIVLTNLALVIPGLVLPTLARIFVDDVLVHRREDWLRPLLVGMLITALARAGLTWLKQKHLIAAYGKVSASHTARFVWALLSRPITFFLARHAGELDDRIRLNDRVAMFLSGRIASSAFDLILVVFYGVLLASYDLRLTAVVAGIAALNLVFLYTHSRKRSDLSQHVQLENGKLLGVTMGALQLIETVKASGSESDLFAKWAGHWAKFQNASQRLETTGLIFSSIPIFLSALSSSVVLALGGYAVIQGTMTVGMLVAYQTLMVSFITPVQNLLAFAGSVQEAKADLIRLGDVKPEIGKLEAALAPAKDQPSKLSGSIQIADVTFGYVPHEAPLIAGFSLKLTPGARIALVGGSGSGKSTVAKLVSGLYEPWSGRIEFDGRTRQEHHPSLLTNSVAMVDQEISLYEGTFRENLTLWDPSIPDEDLIAAARDAVIHADILDRTGGYESKVEEGGRNLSGGQRQRLEIARALVRNPSILLLDEATSALDPKTEELLDENLRRRGCTCLIVAHRLSTIRDCDQILVLELGAVVESGTHEQLMEAGGYYAKLMGSA
jgi:NHLM bacteriocin system ABC transporter peptidase/ATP-binding protein